MDATTKELTVQASPHTKEGMIPTQQQIQQDVGKALVHDAIKNVFGVEDGGVIPPSGQSPVAPEHGMEHPDAEQPLGDVFQDLKVLTIGEKIGGGVASEFENIWANRADKLPAGVAWEDER